MALDFDELTKKFEEFINNPKVIEQIKLESEEKRRREKVLKVIREAQYERIMKFKDLAGFIEKVIDKYNSKKYYDYWYRKRHIEAPNSLFYDLYECALRYGRKLTDEEYNNHENMFTENIAFLGGYVFNCMVSYATFIKVNKLEDYKKYTNENE